MNERLLLDTCAVIWMSQDNPVSEKAAVALSQSYKESRPVYVSAVTAWEMGMLVARGRIRETKTPKRWYDDFREQAEVAEQAVTADIFIASCFLPQLTHKDPIDRILIATAREHDLTIVTRDRAILDYGAAGHVKALAC
ncbi:twitching motility protein PilT [Rhizobium leguminosarum bv. trifolii WSM1689]|uniref:type II toxin-antitoxin system VapC family toxin n=1 Tax=Rhizobium TaxID=379 RepID=UPI0003E09E4B|nr:MULTISPECIES: type II toxin-antitoxin system VapC family toxin [Rhizobium]AHF84880.1 twitching motility protein PilT [Rhizobium leguminosarum bv. trifolii WSM1689]MBY3221347.1 type II toxin-antitoxin system VapC family toxin [Rhizobium laguerreae]MBY5736366.1 type II toxin-antitoxin system VapC family toxin [Rhizobium leguminosarum]